MPPKRKRAEADINWVFDLILHAASVVKPSSVPVEHLDALKAQVLSGLSSTHKETTKPAKEFSMVEAIREFGLQYEKLISQEYFWDIEKEVEGKVFPKSPYLGSLLHNYSKNFDRTSKSVCRTAIDILLNECLTVMKADNVEIEGDASDDRPKTPNPCSDIKIFGEVSFNHKIIPRENAPPSPSIVVSGRIDHGIGLILHSRVKEPTDRRKRFFYSLLLLVEAKHDGSVEHALPQLIVYLASLHQSRLQRNRTDATVYGVASDGFTFVFVKISHEGVVMCSRLFQLFAQREMDKVLVCLRHILETTASRSPNSTQEKSFGGDGVVEADESDRSVDVDDNSYMTPPEDATFWYA